MRHLKELDKSNILIIACGALSKELNYLKNKNSWHNISIQCLNADLHNTPKLIPLKVKEKLDLMADDFDKVYLAYADCGTGGLLDKLLNDYNIERLPGAHCYEFFAGKNQFLKDFEAIPFGEKGFSALASDLTCSILLNQIKIYKKKIK